MTEGEDESGGRRAGKRTTHMGAHTHVQLFPIILVNRENDL